jgi:subtilisin family serine protease
MPPLLVAQCDLERARDMLGRRNGFAPLIGGGLHTVDVPERLYDRMQEEFAGVDADRSMRLPVIGEPTVSGEPMDYHGRGGPLPTRQELRRRLGQPGAPWTGEGVLVGMVDTGVQPHPWLAGGYLSAMDDFEPAPSEDSVSARAASPRAQQQVGHGTFAAGLVLQQAPAAGVWIERALAPTGEGPVSRVVQAAKQLADRGVHVLNLSLGCPATEFEAGAVMRQLVADLRREHPDLVIVAAAGNLDDETPTTEDFWPAACEDVIAVGAVPSPDATRWAEWSNRGRWIDLAAPAQDLLSTHVVAAQHSTDGKSDVCYTGWARWSGSSFATAVVSGAIARLMTGPERLTARQAADRLEDGMYSSAWIESEGDVPSVPVVRLATWDQQGLAEYGAATAG